MNEEAGNPPPQNPAAGGAVPPKPVTPAPATPAAAKPPVAPAPAAARPAAVATPAFQARRQFMINWLHFAWACFAAATAVALSTCVRFLFPNVLFEPKTSFKIGKPDEYEIGLVDTRWQEKYAVWIVRAAEGMYVLSTVCTHLGCTPSWLDNEQKFKCPCHGSGFYKTGINFEGPAPRPLERFAIGLADDGQVLVDKSRKFQYEKGEWSNPASFLAL